ncbi:MAG TPA: RHS repeat-associated core domain-containing protein, partial [Nonomuraea sp.]|nr:RHS repeat-associated core domain-containing protein [Nonomuraea sp.]
MDQYDRSFDTSEDAGTGGIPPKLIITFGSTPFTGQLRTAPIAAGLDGVVYTNATSPTLVADVGDPDGGLIRAEYEVEHDPNANQGTGLVWSGNVDGVASGTEAKITVPAGKLTDGQKLRWRARAFDGTSYSAWSAWQKVAIDATAPPTPTITCDVKPDTWYPRVGDDQQAESCAISGLKGNNAYLWSLDDPAAFNVVQLSRVDSENNDNQSLAIPTVDDGWHTLYVKIRDNAHNTSAVTSYSFGIGQGGFVSPKPSAVVQRHVTLSTAAAGSRTTVRYEYLDMGMFKPIPATDVTPAGSSTPIGSWPQTRTDTTKNFADLTWDVLKTVQGTGRRYIEGGWEIRACFGGAGQTEACTKPAVITVQQSAFNPSQATAELGPGKLALQTGDYAVEYTDASLFGLAVSRTHTTLITDSTDTLHEPGPVNEWNIFGPDWRASFPAAPSNIAAFQPLDDGSQNTLTFTTADGSTLTYLRNGEVFAGVGDAADGSRATVNLAEEQLTVTEATGAKTTYTRLNGRWVVARTQGAAEESTVLYFRDIQGRITRILAPTAKDVTCDTLRPGCRALELSYASATTATGVASGWGDFKDQVKSVSFTAFDPESNAMKTTALASYAYDSIGHLRQVTDPRTNLATVYYYTGEGRISQITPPGLAPWRMDYDNRGRLAHVQREGGDVDPTQAVAYDVPISGTGAPIDLSAAQTVKWGQATDLPVAAAGIFPASHIPARGMNGAYAPAASDWEYASLVYTDVNGRPVNTAGNGAGAWQISAARYDDKGNAVWELSPENRAQALTPTRDTDPYVAGRSDSAERAILLATVSTYNADSDPLTVTEPARQVQLADGSLVSTRKHTSTTYDEGKPSASAVYHLATTTKTEPIMLDGSATVAAADARTIKTGYDPVTSGDTSGWNLRQLTSTTTVMPGQTDIVKKTRYDAAGREIERRQPASIGNDAGSTATAYYTAGAHPTVTACGNKPQWAGLACRRAPVSQPTGKPLPVATIAYGYYGDATSILEAVGTTVRTTTTTYDTAGRPFKTKVVVTPASEGGTPVPESTISYDPATGLRVGVTAGTLTLINGYDAFGRLAATTDADGNTTTIGYTLNGQLASTIDAKGSTTYTYDGTDAAGRSERRGLPTAITAERVGTFTAAYTGDSKLAVQGYPNGLTATHGYDSAGFHSSVVYAKGSTPWLAYHDTSDISGKVVYSGDNLGSTQRYTYDGAGRLTKSMDATNSSCTTRQYKLDLNSNRTSLDAFPGAAGGDCSTSTTPVTKASSFDTADRITNTGYVYDTFGRTTTVPAADVTGGANLTIGYHANDMVASLTQSGTTKTYGLDPRGRIRTINTTTQEGSFGTIVNHYTGGSDSPSWIVEGDGSWTRNITAFAGLAAVERSGGGTQLTLTNLHGDVVATCDNNANASVSAYYGFTEYGPRKTGSSDPGRYGWLGAHQRSSGDSLAGLILMGARLYNPTTGRFLQTDPVLGGSDNPYEYASQDPINNLDLDGKKKTPKKAPKKTGKVTGPKGNQNGWICGVATGWYGTKKYCNIYLDRANAKKMIDALDGTTAIAGVCAGIAGAAAFYAPPSAPVTGEIAIACGVGGALTGLSKWA